MDIKYIETPDGEWVDDYGELEAFPFEDVFQTDDILNQCSNSIKLTFNGDLDNPSLFDTITAVGVDGPKFIVEDSILSLSDTRFYFKVKSTKDLDIESLEDLIHLIEPIIEKDGYTIAFGDFSDWAIDFDDEVSCSRELYIKWTAE